MATDHATPMATEHATPMATEHATPMATEHATAMAAQRARASWSWAARAVSVLALFALAADHLYEYAFDYYREIPTIGTLFLLDAIGGFALGAALMLPTDRLLSSQAPGRVTAVLGLAGIGLAAGSLAGLFVSESTPLFGFMEMGYRTSVVVAIVAEMTAIAALVGLVASSFSSRPSASA
jgi:hypothetical protein